MPPSIEMTWLVRYRFPQHGDRQIGDFVWSPEPADRHLPAQILRLTGKHLGLGDQSWGERVDGDTEGCESWARK
jgi:hypothetical protein